jgi:AcrR family transcriptional regulator
MPRTRSRPKTEEKFQNAVLHLVAGEGFSALGINAVAQKAGADKVLIYRYFGDLNGLLQRVAESRSWLPTAAELVASLPSEKTNGTYLLREVHQRIVNHIHADPTTHQLVRWRMADKNALTNCFTNEWQNLWRELPSLLGNGLEHRACEAWKHACAVVALMIEAELCDEGVHADCLEYIGQGLKLGLLPENVAVYAQVEDDSLPTNLL